jgi:tetratricopeptide (TPR) repeat protein
MNSLLGRTLGLAALACLSVAAATARAQDEAGGDDLVVKKDGNKLAGKITSEDIKGLKVKVDKAELGVTWSQVKSISYNPGGSNFNQAKGDVEGGLYAQAIPALEALKSSSTLRPVLKPHVLNLLGTCHYRVGEFDAAIKVLEDLFAQFPKTQLIARGGGETLVSSYLATKNPAGAKAALDKLTSAAGADGSLAINVLKGRVLEANGDYAGAAAAYSVIMSGAADDITKAEAELGQARCLQGQKKTGEAEAKYRAMVGKDLPWTVLAGAWNGLGSISYENAVQKKDTELMTSAMFQYMRGFVLYTPQAGESTTEYERAMRGSYDCLKALFELTDGKDARKANEKKYYGNKARAVRELLEQKFPKSPYLSGI